MKKNQTRYISEQNLVITQLSGELDLNEIEDWQQSLETVLSQLEPGTKFKILVDLYGFKAKDLEAHKRFRVVVPGILANYGWYVGYLRMFPEATLTLRSQKDIYCVAAAHVHDDETKIRNYSRNYSMHNEYFSTDSEAARLWIDAITVDQAAIKIV